MIEEPKSIKTLIVRQLNCRGLNKSQIEILNILEKTQADIACQNETNLGKKNHPKLEGYTLAGNTKHSRLGSANYIKHRLNYELIETKTNKPESKLTQECITIKSTWTLRNKHLCIATCRIKNGPNNKSSKQRSPLNHW